MVCALTGLNHTHSGEGLGAEEEIRMLPVLEPVLSYQICLPDDCDVHQILSEASSCLKRRSRSFTLHGMRSKNEIYATADG